MGYFPSMRQNAQAGKSAGGEADDASSGAQFGAGEPSFPTLEDALEELPQADTFFRGTNRVFVRALRSDEEGRDDPDMLLQFFSEAGKLIGEFIKHEETLGSFLTQFDELVTEAAYTTLPTRPVSISKSNITSFSQVARRFGVSSVVSSRPVEYEFD